jgi:hypothetical protein
MSFMGSHHLVEELRLRVEDASCKSRKETVPWATLPAKMELASTGCCSSELAKLAFFHQVE